MPHCFFQCNGVGLETVALPALSHSPAKMPGPHHCKEYDMATQSEVAEWCKLTDRQIRNLQKRGIMHRPQGKGSMDLQRAVMEYITYLKADGGGIGLEDEEEFDDPSDPLDRKRKDLNNQILEEKLKKMRRENAPLWVLAEALSKVVELVPAKRAETLMAIKLANPDLPEASVNLIDEKLGELQDALCAIELKFDVDDDNELDDDDE